jgi:hypothetical protein
VNQKKKKYTNKKAKSDPLELLIKKINTMIKSKNVNKKKFILFLMRERKKAKTTDKTVTQ